MFARTRKFWLAAIGAAVLAFVQSAWPDTDWATVVVACLTALGVYATPNQD